MSDLSQQVDDLIQRMDDNDQSFQDFSDSLDASLTDVQNNIDEQSQEIDTLNETAGQLQFPLTQDTIDLITEQSPSILKYLYDNNYIGTVALVAGTKTVNTNLTSNNSLILLSRYSSSGTLGNLSYSNTTAGFIINSSSATDTSTIIYFILN